MTPQLQQAIKLLQLSNLELQNFIEAEIEQNPLLEAEMDGPVVSQDEPPAAPVTPEAPTTAALDRGAGETGEDNALWHEESGREGEGNLDLAGDPEAWSTPRSGAADDLPGLDQTATRPESLREHLVAQLNLDILEPADRMIGLHLIDSLDDAGYIAVDFAEISETLGCTPERIEAVLERVQRFDPSGIFARNLAECLALQLRDRNRLDPAMQALLDNLPLLAARDGAALMRLCGIDAEDLAEMVAEIKSLDPKPGQSFDPPSAQPIIPDVIMRSSPDGGWIIEINSDTLPRVLVNTRYHSEISRQCKDKAAKDYLADRYQSATWLVKSLHQRTTTILKVATEIVRQQDGFFRYGVQYLRPLVLRDIAEAIGMHESTVSRVTTNKYMITPRGIFELKYFFTSSINAASGGGSHSAESVRFRIKGLIDAETAAEILSDDRLVDILLKEGIDIARRTVAKYREGMRIPSSVQRRREKLMRL